MFFLTFHMLGTCFRMHSVIVVPDFWGPDFGLGFISCMYPCGHNGSSKIHTQKCYTQNEMKRSSVFPGGRFLTGNPCTQYEEYREYVIATLPQLKVRSTVSPLPPPPLAVCLTLVKICFDFEFIFCFVFIQSVSLLLSLSPFNLIYIDAWVSFSFLLPGICHKQVKKKKKN